MITIYTDGATSNNGKENAVGGWAYVVVDNGIVIDTQNGHIPNATNNICELTAVVNACKYAEARSIKYCEIISDSAYIINCYNDKWYIKWQKNGWVNSKKQPVANQDRWEQLIPYFNNPNFIFTKVKGHSVNTFNNLADQLAVSAKLTTR